MSDMKWTPGPWLIEDDPDLRESTLATVAWCSAYRIGFETGVKGGNYRDGLHGDEDADAHLIAAAPELYEALDTLLDSYGYRDFLSEKERLADPDVKAAMQALAKARGQS